MQNSEGQTIVVGTSQIVRKPHRPTQQNSTGAQEYTLVDYRRRLSTNYDKRHTR
ncbi:MAG TPA: hypothetical protein VE130_10145 [Nitrososphaeraceae archaeon]|nr:hypothetical protein [Nitrososphaeraceae archaeon]